MSDTIITVEKLGKRYRIQHQKGPRYTTLRDVIAYRCASTFKKLLKPKTLLQPLARPQGGANERFQKTEDFWALKNVSFTVKQGEVIGIIGRNGAGKSTLLKILSRITEPTEGRVRIRGRLASLLEVGTGFHPELTGRENIFLNGAILGMTRVEIKRKFDEIVAFAETEKFLDTPVKRYSSGMYVRLAFAVAAHLEPEILIVDEVLAVGDAQFQKKCLGKMSEVSRNQGRTVIFVSHNMNAVNLLCTKAVVMQAGRVAHVGGIAKAIEFYSGSGELTAKTDLSRVPHSGNPGRLLSVELVNTECPGVPAFREGQEVIVKFKVEAKKRMFNPHVSIGFTNTKGERAFAVGSNFSDGQLAGYLDPGMHTVEAKFVLPPIVPDRYALDVGLGSPTDGVIQEIYASCSMEVLDTNYLKTTMRMFDGMGQVLVRSAWQLADEAAEVCATAQKS